MLRLGGYLLLAAAFSTSVNQAAWAQTSYGQAGASEGKGDDALSQRGWLITPSIDLNFTQTDNVTLQPNDKKSDLITRISPGVRLQGQSARAQAYIDFKLQQVNYAESEGKDNLQRALTGFGTVELVDNWLYLDMSGRISQQAISAFGTPSSGSSSINSNVVESSMYQFAPYIRGRLFGNAEYNLRFDNTYYTTKSGSLNDTTIQSLQGNIGGTTSLNRLSWGVNANAQQYIYSNNLKNNTGAVRASLTYAVDPQFRVTAIGGEETQDYVNFTSETTSITGVGFEWAPTERTQIAYTHENRYFGEGHSFKFNHRTANTAWRLIDTRDAVMRPPQSLTASLGTQYDLYSALVRAQNPNASEALIQQVTLAAMQQAGVNPQQLIVGGYMSSRATLNRNKEASFTWLGVRNLVTFSAQSEDRNALGTGNLIPDDFSLSALIKQKGVSVNWSHRLTPTASLAALANKSRTTGLTTNLNSDYLTYSLTLTNKLGAYTSGSLGVRRTEVTGVVDYVENAVIGSLLMVF